MEYIYVFPYSLFSSERSTVKTNKEHDLPVAEWRREHSEGSFICTEHILSETSKFKGNATVLSWFVEAYIMLESL